MTDKFNVEAFQDWQRLVEAWDDAERELKAIEAARTGSDSSQREAELRDELARLKQQIDLLVQHISANRETVGKEMMVALLDTKPEGQRLSGIARAGTRRPAGKS